MSAGPLCVKYTDMGTKTISIREEAYERLRAARRHEGESFSEVVLRAQWPELGISGRELLEISRARGPVLSEAELDDIERAKAEDRPPEDKWPRS